MHKIFHSVTKRYCWRRWSIKIFRLDTIPILTKQSFYWVPKIVDCPFQVHGKREHFNRCLRVYISYLEIKQLFCTHEQFITFKYLLWLWSFATMLMYCRHTMSWYRWFDCIALFYGRRLLNKVAKLLIDSSIVLSIIILAVLDNKENYWWL